MKYFAIALAVVGTIATVGSASATYRLSSNPSFAERDRYETYHSSINQFHGAELKQERVDSKANGSLVIAVDRGAGNMNDPHKSW